MNAIRCGTCHFWKLSGYAEAAYLRGDLSWPDQGDGGPHTDGTVSECRRHAPAAPRDPSGDDRLFGDRRFPTTRREDWCGEHAFRDFVVPKSADIRARNVREQAARLASWAGL